MFSSNTSQVSGDANWIEECFSTYLYQGNGSTQTITNGIDLAGKGGLVWIKRRSTAAYNCLFDTARGANNVLWSNTTTQQITYPSPFALTSFNSNGFTLNAEPDVNQSGSTYASWAFRKQPKFFDVVTYTGTGAQWNAAHSLGSVPGFIVCKATSTTSDWVCWHRGNGSGVGTANGTGSFALNLTSAPEYASGYGTPCNAATFNPHLISGGGLANQNGVQYVAYLFAHNAGGFGLTGTDNVISCGSYTGAGYPGPVTVNLGYEPQWVLIKRTDNTSNWVIFDTMRGWPANNNSTSGAQSLKPNLSAAEGDTAYGGITSTGFQWFGSGDVNEPNVNGGTYIYIAIRRGPMKTPTSGTSVYGASGASTPTFSFPPDLAVVFDRYGGAGYANNWTDRLRGSQRTLETSSTAAEVSQTGNTWYTFSSDGANNSWGNGWGSPQFDIQGFRRAPGFFDEVCYTGTAVQQNITHNLGVAPELLIVKRRSGTGTDWAVYAQPLGASYDLQLNSTGAATTGSQGYWASTTPTASVFTVRGSGGGVNDVNSSGGTYVAYLFASCPGVSKVGSYTGNGSTQTINCGFTGGARFVLIKRTDSTGDWYVYDTARGMTTLTDPYLLLNSTAAESATLGSVTTVTTGFAVNASILAAINTNAASYIFLAIA